MGKKIFFVISLIVLTLLVGCSKPNVEVVEAEFAKGIYSGGQPILLKGISTSLAIGKNGVWSSFVDHKIIVVSLNLNYQPIHTKEEVGSDKHKSEVYEYLSKYARFYNDGVESKLVWGYWPDKVSETSASNLKLFYVIPDNTDLNKLKFEFEYSILNGIKGVYTYTKFNKMKPLS